MNKNLIALHAKVDAFFDGFAAKWSEQMACAAGCSGCCHQSLSLFEVELDRLRAAVDALDEPARRRLALRASSDDGPCPLLEDGQCVAYDARPTICRSHGAAIAFQDGEHRLRDVCPLNFAGPVPLEAVPDSDLLDLDRVNALLALTNRLAAEEAGADLERRPLRSAIRGWLEQSFPPGPDAA